MKDSFVVSVAGGSSLETARIEVWSFLSFMS